MAINLSVEGVASNLSLEGMTKLLQQRHQEGEPGQEEHVVLNWRFQLVPSLVPEQWITNHDTLTVKNDAYYWVINNKPCSAN